MADTLPAFPEGNPIQFSCYVQGRYPWSDYSDWGKDVLYEGEGGRLSADESTYSVPLATMTEIISKKPGEGANDFERSGTIDFCVDVLDNKGALVEQKSYGSPLLSNNLGAAGWVEGSLNEAGATYDVPTLLDAYKFLTTGLFGQGIYGMRSYIGFTAAEKMCLNLVLNSPVSSDQRNKVPIAFNDVIHVSCPKKGSALISNTSVAVNLISKRVVGVFRRDITITQKTMVNNAGKGERIEFSIKLTSLVSPHMHEAYSGIMDFGQEEPIMPEGLRDSLAFCREHGQGIKHEAGLPEHWDEAMALVEKQGVSDFDHVDALADYNISVIALVKQCANPGIRQAELNTALCDISRVLGRYPHLAQYWYQSWGAAAVDENIEVRGFQKNLKAMARVVFDRLLAVEHFSFRFLHGWKQVSDGNIISIYHTMLHSCLTDQVQAYLDERDAEAIVAKWIQMGKKFTLEEIKVIYPLAMLDFQQRLRVYEEIKAVDDTESGVNAFRAFLMKSLMDNVYSATPDGVHVDFWTVVYKEYLELSSEDNSGLDPFADDQLVAVFKQLALYHGYDGEGAKHRFVRPFGFNANALGALLLAKPAIQDNEACQAIALEMRAYKSRWSRFWHNVWVSISSLWHRDKPKDDVAAAATPGAVDERVSVGQAEREQAGPGSVHGGAMWREDNDAYTSDATIAPNPIRGSPHRGTLQG